MFQVFRNAWKDPALRKKILFTLLIIVIFRFGAAIFVPFLEPSTIKQMMGEGTILNYLDVMTGGSLSNGTLFAMSITPYINASIIVQLLTVAIPALERLSKEGEEGRKKINKITKYVALGIGLFQAIAFYIGLRNTVNETTHKSAVLYTEGFDGVIAAITIVACFVAGASLIIWLGDQISQKGIGNGISMILFAGIISRVPDMVINLIKQISVAPQNWFFVPLILVIYVLMIAFVILMTNAERRIPVQYAKRVRRSDKPHSDKGCNGRRYAYHLCDVNYVASCNNRILLRCNCNIGPRILERLYRSVQHKQRGLCNTLFLPYHRLQLLLYCNAV